MCAGFGGLRGTVATKAWALHATSRGAATCAEASKRGSKPAWEQARAESQGGMLLLPSLSTSRRSPATRRAHQIGLVGHHHLQAGESRFGVGLRSQEAGEARRALASWGGHSAGRGRSRPRAQPHIADCFAQQALALMHSSTVLYMSTSRSWSGCMSGSLGWRQRQGRHSPRRSTARTARLPLSGARWAAAAHRQAQVASTQLGWAPTQMSASESNVSARVTSYTRMMPWAPR